MCQNNFVQQEVVAHQQEVVLREEGHDKVVPQNKIVRQEEFSRQQEAVLRGSGRDIKKGQGCAIGGRHR